MERPSDTLIIKLISTSDFAGQQHGWCHNMSSLIQRASRKYYDLLNTNMAFESSRKTTVIQICVFYTVHSARHSRDISFVCYSVHPAKHSRDTGMCLLECPSCKAFSDINLCLLQCPPCKAFTPQLIETYSKVRARGRNFEVIFVSSDR
jgi:thiol-disulfide isomerase/thioredoxin